MILLLTIVSLVTLLVPGLAAVHLFCKRLSPEQKFILAPAVTIVVFAAAGLVGWFIPHHFLLISRSVVWGLTGSGIVVLLLTGGYRLIKALDPVLPLAYGLLVVIASQIAFLPVRVPTEFPGHLRYVYYVHGDYLPVRIQALYHNLPNDNLISYRFAQFMLHGVDFRVPREWDNPDRPAIAPGQSVTARTPLMALTCVHYINLFGPRTPVDGKHGKLGDLLTDDAYIPFFLAAVCLNALLILPGYLIAERLSGKLAARLTLLLLACNFGIVIQTNFIWPKALAGYFAGLLVYHVLDRSPRAFVLGILAAMTYYAHQCGMALVIGACLFYGLYTSDRLRAGRSLLIAGLAGLILILPWHLWAALVIGDTGNLVSQNMFQNADQSLSRILGIRVINVLRTLIPHAVATADIPTPNMLFVNAFFTLPGMLGLLVVPFFAATLWRRRLALFATVAGLGSVLITAATFGQNHAGLTPFGPFLFIPTAMAFAMTALVRLPVRLRTTLAILMLLEQIAAFSYGLLGGPHMPELAEFSAHDLVRSAGLAAAAGLLLIAILIAARGYKRTCDD